jgi:voltage-gated potassium channel
VLGRVSTTVRAIVGTNALGWVLAACALVVVLGAGTVMVAEPDLGHCGDAVWWAVVTATTVGYGDIAPVTLAGRAVAVVLMIVGIGTLGMITGSIATYFVGQHRGPANPHLRHLRGLLDDWDDLTAVERRQAAAILETLANDADVANGERA